MQISLRLKALLAVSLATAPLAALADPIKIDFESLGDGTYVTTQYTGATFSNAIVLTAGISLNEFDFPPESGVNVAADINGPMSIAFSTPVFMFSGYFTYAEPLTVQGYDASGQLEASAASLFSANYVSGGDLGSSPNELIQLYSGTPFTRIVLTGDPSGSSFTVDDLSYDTANGMPVSPTPEPSELVLTCTGLAASAGWARVKRYRAKVRSAS